MSIYVTPINNTSRDTQNELIELRQIERPIHSFLERILEPVEGKITIMGTFLGVTKAYNGITSWSPTC
jgi:hypothetical protein